MKLSFLLVVFCVFLSIPQSFAYNVEFGEAERSDKRHKITMLGNVDGKLYIYKFKAMPLGVEKHTIFQFDPNSLSSTNEFELDLKSKNLETISIFNGKILIFQKERISQDNQARLYYDVYEANTMKKVKENVELASYEYKRVFFGNYESFKVLFSEDESKLAIYYDLPYEKGDAEKFGFKVFDQELNELYGNKETKLPMLDDLMHLGSPYIANDGRFYISALETLEKGFFGQPKSVSHIIFGVDDQGELVEHKLDLPNRYIYDYTFSQNSKGELVCTGLYGDKGKSGVSGGFYLRLNSETRELEQDNYREFPDEFITSGWSDRAKKKAKKKKDKGKGSPKLYNYDIRAIVTLEDGGAVFVAEQFYIVITTYRDANGNTRTTYHYYYNDIIVMRLDGKGEFKWHTKIPKYQHSTNDNGYYSSFAFHVGQEKLYFMFNDNIKNFEDGNATGGRTYPTSFTSNKKNITSLAEINLSDGKFSKNKLFGKADLGTIAVPKIHFSDYNANVLYIYSKKKRMERLGKITF
ncbi:MAG: hypothetical protein HUJ25_01010 [Crocinitomicaceae bacterium]|nr:hypothetical protein [Crocinitomicaceae bacterium]